MPLRLSNPEWLYAVLLAAPLVLFGVRFLTGMTVWRRWSAVLLRLTLLSLIAVLLAGASSVKVTDKLAVVFVVDASGSVLRPASTLSQSLPSPPDRSPRPSNTIMDVARNWIDDATSSRGPDDFVGVVAFADDAIAVVNPTRDRTLDWSADLPLGDASNLERAVRLARTLLPPDSAGRIVLVSDGNQTSGDLLAAVRESAAGQAGPSARPEITGLRGVIPTSVLPLAYEINNEVFVESFDAPPRAPAGSNTTLRVVLTSTGSATGSLRLTDEGRTVDINGSAPGDSKRVELREGQNPILLDVPLGEGRVHRFRVTFEPDDASSAERNLGGDTLLQNNSAEAFTLTPGSGAVLLLDGVNGGSGTTLGKTLRESGMAVDTIRPDLLPSDLLSLQAYDLIVFENVPAEAIPVERQRTLLSYVKDLGGGLFIVGGPEAYTAGGWRGSELAAIWPVSLDLPDKLLIPDVAIVFVLDNSGSMNFRVAGSLRTQQDIANEAAALAITSLDKKDLVGVITFNDGYEVLVELAPNTDAPATAGVVKLIGAGGGTRAGEAIRRASDDLSRAVAKNKHIIVMSDGRAIDAETLPTLCQELASSGIQVSTIAVGDKADPETMRAMASRGGGTYYSVVNPSILPKVFVRAVRVVRSPLVRETPFIPRVAQLGSPLLAGVEPVGELGGLTLTQPRKDPLVTTALINDEGEPVLAHWQVELGRVAAFTSDASAWASKWIQTPGFRRFWGQAARVTARTDLASRGLDARVVAADGRLLVRLDANDGITGKPLDGLDTPVTVYSPSGKVTEARLTQAGPGRYEASLDAPESGTYIVLSKPRQGERRLTPVIAGASSSGGLEFKQLRSNIALLERAAAESGGTVLSLADPASAKLFDRGGIKPLEVLVPIWRPLLIWTLVILLLDIATRRLAWDRWVSRDFGDGLASQASAAVFDRGRHAAATLAALRSAAPETSPEPPLGYSAPVLGDQDAGALVQAARDRRRARAVKEYAEDSAPQTQPDSSLLAAKRRASQRFRDEETRD